MKPAYKGILSRQAEQFYKKLEVKAKAKVRDCLISLEEEVYAGRQQNSKSGRAWKTVYSKESLSIWSG